jgi:hypothetical protein
MVLTTENPRDDNRGQTAYRKVDELVRTLGRFVEQDPDQEVCGIVVPVLDAVITLARDCVPDDLVVGRMDDVISADLIADGCNVRAADALLMASQLRTALRRFMPVPGV